MADLVSNNNPMGTVANSDLKLAGTVAHQDVLVQHHNCNHRTVHVLNDNVSAVVWQKKALLPLLAQLPTHWVSAPCTNATTVSWP